MKTLSKFKRISCYDNRPGRNSRESLFSSPDVFRLSDKAQGKATISKYSIGNMVVGQVRSTGHEVEVRESFGVSIVVPLQGYLRSSANRKEHEALANVSALLFSPNRRKTEVFSPNGDEFLGVPVVVPFSEIANAAERMGIPLRQANRTNSFSFALSHQKHQLSGELVHGCMAMYSEIARGSRRLDLPGVHTQWSQFVSEKVVELLDDAGLFHLPQIASLSTKGRHVKRAMEYMRANLSDIVMITEVARACGLSNRTLEQAFKDAVSMTPLQVLTSFRLDEARAMLLAPDDGKSVTDAALACGFRHLGRFARVYGERFGELPSETRARR